MGRNPKGGSTITQQLARNLFLSTERSVDRKLKELFLARRLESTLSKERILELYLNVIELGENVWGISHATEHYFGKTPRELGVFESVFLSSLPPAPRQDLVGGNLQRSLMVQKRVLQNLFQTGRVDMDAWSLAKWKLQWFEIARVNGHPLGSALDLPFVPPNAEPPPRHPIEQYEQVALSEAEQSDLLDEVRKVIGHPYVWGGDTVEKGFDCSGLIQWAYRELGVNQFRNGGGVYPEIAAHELHQYNTRPLGDIGETRTGDFIFFDENGDGRITHISILDRVDEQGRVWVYDASSNAGAVVYRTVEDFWNKRPIFGRPLKTLPRTPGDTGQSTH